MLILDGPVVEPDLVPGQIGPDQITVKWANWFTYKSATSAPAGISSGNLDPVIGMAPMDSAGIAWPDVVSIAVWRKLDWMRIIFATFFLLPMALGLWIPVFTTSPGFLIGALPMTALCIWMFYKAIGIRQQWMRIVGLPRTLTFRFDVISRRRKKFYASVMRRAGIGEPPEIP